MATACACGGGKEPETPKAPEAPTGITLHSATETTLSFQWGVVNGADSYDWRLAQGSTEVQSGNVKGRSVIVSDLTAGTSYRFSVRSVGEGGSSPWSAILEASTEGPQQPDPGPGPGPDVSARYEEFLIPAAEEDGKARAFPGAEGGGMYATGGRGGRVIHVTTLADNNSEGSLRWAVSQSGARTVVFDVAGTIELAGTLNINKGDLTIAGQTAPGDGICLKNYRVAINASNVVIRYIRCRMGDEKKTEDDAMNIMTHTNGQFKNIVIDHCSLSWSTDECASFYGMNDFTLQWCIISESLRNSVHGKGSHGYGGIWGGENATYHHNLLAHHDSRNPRIDHDYVSTQKGPVSLVNNVIYNWGGNTCYGGESANNNGEFKKYNVINNYYKPGPATNSRKIWFIDPTTSCSNCSGLNAGPVVPGHFYMSGNYMYGKSAMTADNWTGTSASSATIAKIKADAPFGYESNPTSLSIHGAEAALDAVLAHAGASLARDSVDERVTKETKDGTFTHKGSNGSTGGLIDTQSDVGGWPEYKASASQLDKTSDTDGDGIPNWFEDEFGLDKFNASDGAAGGLDKNGRYTNLEMYLHWLVKEITAGCISGATYTKL